MSAHQRSPSRFTLVLPGALAAALAATPFAQQQNIPGQTTFLSGSTSGDFGRALARGDFFLIGAAGGPEFAVGDPLRREVRAYQWIPTSSTIVQAGIATSAASGYGTFLTSDLDPAIADLSGDGYAEVLVSAPGQFVDVYSFYGGGVGAGSITSFAAPAGSTPSFGASAAIVRGWAAANGAVCVVGEPEEGIPSDPQCGSIHVFLRIQGLAWSGTEFLNPEYSNVNVSASGARFGAAICLVNDVNGDGVRDFAVGAPGNGTNGMTGSVFLFSGGALLGTTLTKLAGSPRAVPCTPNGLGGSSLAYLPGNPPYLVVGSPNDETLSPGIRRGRVDLLRLDGTFTPHPNFPNGIRGTHTLTSGSGFGSSVAVTPDIDGDGISEIIVGAASEAMHGANSGGAVVISTGTGQVLFQTYGDAAGAAAGLAVAGVDFDNDTIGDLIVGIPDAVNAAGQNVGAFRWYRGGARSFRGSSQTLRATGTGSVTLTIDIPTGSSLIGRTYFVVGSMSGITPGFDLFGTNMPLNVFHPVTLVPDPLFPLVGAYLSAPTGTITAAGSITVGSISAPTPPPPGIIGTTISHAFFTIDPLTGVAQTSNAISFTVTN